jgi:hypothetical protein
LPQAVRLGDFRPQAIVFHMPRGLAPGSAAAKVAPDAKPEASHAHTSLTRCGGTACEHGCDRDAFPRVRFGPCTGRIPGRYSPRAGRADLPLPTQLGRQARLAIPVWRLHRKVAGLLSREDAADVSHREPPVSATRPSRWRCFIGDWRRRAVALGENCGNCGNLSLCAFPLFPLFRHGSLNRPLLPTPSNGFTCQRRAGRCW